MTDIILRNAFGNPDGSRAEIEDILKNFVGFNNNRVWGGLATTEDDLSARVIVGRKGAGKTVYLRRLQAYSSKKTDLSAGEIQQNLPTTNMVIKFCQMFLERDLTENWMQLWRVAILNSITSQLLYGKHLNKFLSSQDKNCLYELTKKKLLTSKVPQSVSSQIKEIINKYSGDKAMVRHLGNSEWDDIEILIGDLIKLCPPICLYIDAVDEEFSHAPMYWKRCQKGLFYQTMRFLRNQKLGGRLHVIICIRDVVLSSVLRGEHATRYLEEPHIRSLSWNNESVAYFLKQKLKTLNKEYIMHNPENERSVKSWLGIHTVTNGRKTTEPIIRYLLRHTRCLPRDIVIVGNMLSDEVIKAKGKAKAKGEANQRTRLSSRIIRRTIGKAAGIFAREQLQICANHITSDQMPADATIRGYTHIYTSGKEYIRGAEDTLVNIVGSVGKDRFSIEELREMENLCAEEFGKEIGVLSILWQNGLLGYVKNEEGKDRSFFYNCDPINRFNIPLNLKEYVFHPILSHYVNMEFTDKIPLETLQ